MPITSEKLKETNDDELIFAAETDAHGLEYMPHNENWKILVVDDETDVHKVTKLVLSGLTFLGKSFDLISCYTRTEAENILKEIPDIAIVILDVVMEENDSGLRLVRFIRDELANNLVRIILRTGHPGQAPETQIIIQYDINDYKSKTELTSEKLTTAIISALRSYRDIITVNRSKKGLERIISASATIFGIQSFRTFVSGSLLQLVSILQLESDSKYSMISGISASVHNNVLRIMAATGRYSTDLIDRSVKDAVEPKVYKIISQAFAAKKSILDKNHYVAYFRSKSGNENIIYLERTENISEWEKDLIEIFCSNITIAFDNLDLTHEIEESQKEIVVTLGAIIDSRSNETQNHVIRVGQYCKFIGRIFGMDEKESEILSVASALHDIGKLAIPDAILQKPSKLTEEEYAIMKKHAKFGGEMFRYSTRHILRPAGIIAMQHHERYDGTGYPLGLKGEGIHIYARIGAVADVFDALTTDRIYRKAMPFDEVIAYFENEKGKQFDPRIVDILLQNIDEIRKITDNKATM